MEHYKIGDKVRILPREGDEKDYPCTYVTSMKAHTGDIMTIKYIRPMSAEDIKEFSSRSKYNGDNNAYILEEDTGRWSWHSSMFVKAGEEQDYITCKIGDVRISPTIDEEIINEILNTQDYENRLQKSKTSIRRGNCPKGREISCRKNKATVSVGHLSYRKCHC